MHHLGKLLREPLATAPTTTIPTEGIPPISPETAAFIHWTPTHLGMDIIIKSLLEKGGACTLDSSAGKSGDDECTELGKHTTNFDVGNAMLRFCAPAGNKDYCEFSCSLFVSYLTAICTAHD